MKAKWLVAALLALLLVAGCSGTGGMGGQGISINLYQNSPEGEVPTPAAKDLPKAGNYSQISIEIADGGTSMIANPSAKAQKEPTTQPSK